jgi:hypothetical protein
MTLNEAKTQVDGEISGFWAADRPQNTQYGKENVNIFGIIPKGRILQIPWDGTDII